MLTAWFSTVVVLLENERWGIKFPVLMRELFKGKLDHSRANQALFELQEVRCLLPAFPPEKLVWDFEDRAARPPWGPEISPEITSLANYFVISDGKDLMEVMLDAFTASAKSGQDVKIA